MLGRWEAFGKRFGSDCGEVVQSAIIVGRSKIPFWIKFDKSQVIRQGPDNGEMTVREANQEWIILIVICPDPKVDDEPCMVKNHQAEFVIHQVGAPPGFVRKW